MSCCRENTNVILLSAAIVCLLALNAAATGSQANKLPLSKYAELDYSDFDFESLGHHSTGGAKKQRPKRHVVVNGIDSPVLDTNRLKFQAFDRKFEIYLKKDISLVSDDVDIEVRYASGSQPTKHMKDFFSSNYYSGFVEGESRSHVICYYEMPPLVPKNETKKEKEHHANETTTTTTTTRTSESVTPPLIFAQIHIQNDHENTVYYIEPLLLPGDTTSTNTNTNTNTSSSDQSTSGSSTARKYKYIVYRTDDIDSSVIANGFFNQSVCRPKYAASESAEDSSSLDSSSFALTNSSYFNEIVRRRTGASAESASSKRKRLSKRDTGDDAHEHEMHEAASAATSTDRHTATKNRCHLALVADHRFFKEIGNSNVKLTTAYLMNVIGAINTIFTRTRWTTGEGDESGDSTNTNNNNNNNNNDRSSSSSSSSSSVLTNFGFVVDKVIVLAEPTPAAADGAEHYNSAGSSTDADRILELFGEEDWSAYCLAHLFTYQSFAHSVLGLAYVSSPLAYTLGGVCSAVSRSRHTRSFSVNTGLSSYRSVSRDQGRLLQREAELVTAHEFGHNWGSEHDPLKAECSPASGQNGGNYLMYAYSNQGHERNNFYFSPCSVKAVHEVLRAKSARCFRGEALSFCGNDRIEGDEQCDAGLAGRQDADPCCDYNCRLRPGAACADANHYCCAQCQLAPRGKQCYASSNYVECFLDHSFCTGAHRDCPPQKAKSEHSVCHSYDQGKCSKNGQCMSLCQQHDSSYVQCKCADTQRHKCMVCCRRAQAGNQSSAVNIAGSECRPIQEIFHNHYTLPVFLSDGRACQDGLCENRECRQKVKDYVSRFWKVIQTVTVSGFVEFMKRNIVGSIIIVSLSFWVPISCCIHFCVDKRVRTLYRRKMELVRSERYQNVHPLSSTGGGGGSIRRTRGHELVDRSTADTFETQRLHQRNLVDSSL